MSAQPASAAPARTWFPTKSAWAAAEAAKYRAQINELPKADTHDTRGIRRRMQAIEHLQAEARRMEKIAEHFRRKGQ